MKLFFIIALFIYGLTGYSQKNCDPEVVLHSLVSKLSPAKEWRESFAGHWTSDVKLSTTNGIEIEGVINPKKYTEKDIASLFVSWLMHHPSELITDVKMFELRDFYIEVSFLFKGNLKFFEVKKEKFFIRDEFHSDGIEMSSFIIKDQDDLRLFSEMQEQFYKFGVKEENRVAGIHNHLGLAGLLDTAVKSPVDRRIIKLYQNFKKIEQGLYDYFSTHPYRNPESGQTNSVDSVIGKNQSIRIAKETLDDAYRTIELRLFNAVKDPQYLGQAIRFNNRFLEQYFDKASGFKKWMDSKSEISIESLFKKLELDYKPMEYKYPIMEGKLSDFEPQLEIFGQNISKAFDFLDRSLAVDIFVEEFRKNLYAQLNLYSLYLLQAKKYPLDKLLSEVTHLLESQKQIYKKNKITFDIEQFVSNANFRELPKEFQKGIVNYFFPKGLAKASSNDLDAVFRGNMAENFNGNSFDPKDLKILYAHAEKGNRVDGALNIITLQLAQEGKVLNDFILSKKSSGIGFERKILEYILKYRRDMSIYARVHLEALLNIK